MLSIRPRPKPCWTRLVIKRGADGNRFKLKLLPAPFFNETKQFGDYLRQALAKIGIDAEVVSNDTPAHLKAVYTDHDFDITVATPVYRSDPAISTTILLEMRPAGGRAVSPTSTAMPMRM